LENKDLTNQGVQGGVGQDMCLSGSFAPSALIRLRR